MANPTPIPTNIGSGQITRPTVAPKPSIGDLLGDITRDMKTIAGNELELARAKLADFMQNLVAKAAVMVLGVVVALIGLGMLCMVVVVALAPVIPALWLRLLIMAVAYIAIGGVVTLIFAKRMTHGPNLQKQIDEVGETIDAVKRGLNH